MIGLLLALLTTGLTAGLEVRPNCSSQYHPLLWSDGLSDWPERPYCWTDAPMVPGDLDLNGVVQSEPGGDLDWFEMCACGPNVPYPTWVNGRPIYCQGADFDKDGDVDQSDFGILQTLIGTALWNQ